MSEYKALRNFVVKLLSVRIGYIVARGKPLGYITYSERGHVIRELTVPWRRHLPLTLLMTINKGAQSNADDTEGVYQGAECLTVEDAQ